MVAAELLDDEDHRALLTVAGELDIATAPRVRTAVAHLMGQGIRHVEVDLSDCVFIDSSGMGALLWSAHRLRAAGGDLVVLHAHGATARTIEMAGVSAIVPVRA
jgi:anti-sigma B factor antagonist